MLSPLPTDPDITIAFLYVIGPYQLAFDVYQTTLKLRGLKQQPCIIAQAAADWLRFDFPWWVCFSLQVYDSSEVAHVSRSPFNQQASQGSSLPAQWQRAKRTSGNLCGLLRPELRTDSQHSCRHSLAKASHVAQQSKSHGSVGSWGAFRRIAKWHDKRCGYRGKVKNWGQYWKDRNLP